MNTSSKQQAGKIFACILVCIALANGMGDGIFSNYFNEVFHIDSVQRGFIEVPRESPGVLCMVVVAALGFLGNLRMAIVAQCLSLIGLVAMGFFSPAYGVMLAFLFIHSLGTHLFMPLNDSLSMSLADTGKEGATLGKFKSVTTMSSMISASLVFVGFRTGIFTFQSKKILPFILASGFVALAILLLFLLLRTMKTETAVKNHRLLFRKRYLPYYMVTLAYGCQKRIRIVFAPWVIVKLLEQGADTVALLTIVTHFVGTLVAPVIGRMLDRLGTKKMLWMEAGYIAVTFSVMGLISGMLSDGTLSKGGPQAFLVFGAYILCILFEQFNMVHAFMMRSIALDKSEVTRTLSVGLSVDHIMAIIASPIMGLIWEAFGVQYVFYLAALSALFQLVAASMAEKSLSASAV